MNSTAISVSKIYLCNNNKSDLLLFARKMNCFKALRFRRMTFPLQPTVFEDRLIRASFQFSVQRFDIFLTDTFFRCHEHVILKKQHKSCISEAPKSRSGDFTSNASGSDIQVILNRIQTLQGCSSWDLGLGASAVREHKTQIALNHPIITSVMIPIPLAAGARSALAWLLWACQQQASVKFPLIRKSFDISADLFTHNCNTFIALVRTWQVLWRKWLSNCGKKTNKKKTICTWTLWTQSSPLFQPALKQVNVNMLQVS